MRAVKVYLTTVCVLLLSAGVCVAQAGPGGGPGGQGGQGGQGRGRRGAQAMVQMRTERVFRALEDLELTEAQKQTTEALRQEISEKAKPLVDRLQTVSRDLRARLQDDPDDKVGIQEMETEIRGITDKLAELETELTEKVRALLKPEQLTKFNEALTRGRGQGRGQGRAFMARMLAQVLPVPQFILRQLNLTPQQQTEVDKIVDEYHVALEKLNKEYNERIEKQLTPEQVQELQRLEDQGPPAPPVPGNGPPNGPPGAEPGEPAAPPPGQ